MTRIRKFGSETPYAAWMRSNPALDAQAKALYIMDADYIIWQFKLGVLYFLEVKSRSGSVGRHQSEVRGY